MAGIINVNSKFNLDEKRVSTKLSFEVGESFMARIVNGDEKSSELVLKLSDGWQFNAKLEKSLDFVPNGLVRFEVQGFDGDKLLLKIVPVKSEEAEQNSSIDNVLKDQNLNVGKEDFELLQKMVKYNIPLTRENISSIKTLVDFKNKLQLNEGQEDAFINKYINSKGIDIDSSKGKEMKASLESFFKELKNIGTDDLLTLKENNIEVTEENLKSFNKLFKEPKAIYKSIMEVKVALENGKLDIKNNENTSLQKEDISSVKTSVDFKNKLELNGVEKDSFIQKYINSKGLDIDSSKGKAMKASLESLFEEFKNIGTEDLLSLKENNIEVTDGNIKKENISSVKTSIDFKNKLELSGLEKDAFIDKYINSKGIDIDSSKGKTMKESLDSLFKEFNNITKVAEESQNINKGIKESEESQNINKGIKESVENKNIDNGNKIIEGNKNLPVENKVLKEGSLDTEVQSNIANSQEKESPDSIIVRQSKENGILLNNKDTSTLVKEEITMKTDQLKDIIKNLIQEKTNLKPEMYDKLLQNIKGNINDFKVFNSVSNQYYYLDMPLKVREEEYNCKLMIKDDRKKDKNIDTKDIKLVVTVGTGNMGVVDSYIKVKNKIMNINMKCEKDWVKVLDLGKEKILKGLENSGYNIHISVEKKQEEANLTNCSEFFNDVSISSINTRA